MPYEIKAWELLASYSNALAPCENDSPTAVRWDVCGIDFDNHHKARLVKNALEAAEQQGRKNHATEMRKLLNYGN